jgi:SEC-C motif-containing protein
MRSRYSAFAVGDAPYLIATRASPAAAAEPDEPAELERWAKSVTWLKLEVREVAASADPDEGFVAFTATYLQGDSLVALSERSRFVRHEGRWRYVDGEPEATRSKVPRNELCPCGSGRKFKHCHA